TSENLETRGATPVFTMVKQQLREWIESRLSALKWNGARWNPEPTVLQEELNGELRQAGLFWGSSRAPGCPGGDRAGVLGPIVLDMKAGSWLVVRTAVGIQQCSYDESAYAYERIDSHWQRFWQSQQDIFEEGKYFPQTLREVLISAQDFSPGADKAK